MLTSETRCVKLVIGGSIFGKGQAEERDADKTPAGSVNLLDDTLLELPCANAAAVSQAAVSSHRCHPHLLSPLASSLLLVSSNNVQPLDDPFSELPEVISSQCHFQSYVRRKTIIKDGRKTSLSSWQRFWLELAENALVFYASKSFKGFVEYDQYKFLEYNYL